MDVYDEMYIVLSSGSLLETAKHLSSLAEMALHEKNRKHIADIFKRRLLDTQLIFAVHGLTLPGFSSGEEKKHLIFSGEQAVQQYLARRIDRSLPPVKFFQSLSKLSQEILEDFMEPSGKQVSTAFIKKIFIYLDEKFCFTERVYRKSIPTFILPNCSNRKLNSVTALTDNSDERGIQFVFLYHLNPGTEFTPEFVLLHELGHIVQNRYGSSNAPPKSFLQFIKKESLAQLDTYELCEIFADAFAMAIMCDSPFSQYDMINDVLLETKRDWREYFTELIV